MDPLKTSSRTSQRMARVRQKGTDAELALRRELHRLGLRYRVDFQVLDKPRRTADIAFPGRKIAVFIDGCFWHGCPQHATWPKQNAAFWREKIETNKRRDADTNERLSACGWLVLRFWEHEPADDAAQKVSEVIAKVDAQKRRPPSHDSTSQDIEGSRSADGGTD